MWKVSLIYWCKIIGKIPVVIIGKIIAVSLLAVASLNQSFCPCAQTQHTFISSFSSGAVGTPACQSHPLHLLFSQIFVPFPCRFATHLFIFLGYCHALGWNELRSLNAFAASTTRLSGLVCGLWASSGYQEPQTLSRCGWCARFGCKGRCERGEAGGEQGGMAGVQLWIEWWLKPAKFSVFAAWAGNLCPHRLNFVLLFTVLWSEWKVFVNCFDLPYLWTLPRTLLFSLPRFLSFPLLQWKVYMSHFGLFFTINALSFLYSALKNAETNC